MKKHIIITTIAALGFIAAPLGHADHINIKELPPAVQKTITAQSPAGGEIKGLSIEREKKDGAYVYEVEFQNKGKDKKIWIAEDGSIVKNNNKDHRDVSTVRVAGEKIPNSAPGETRGLGLGTKFEQLPAAVQASVKAHGGSEQIADIDKSTKNGRTVYSVEFKEPGKNPKIWIAEDGTMVKHNAAVKEGAGAEIKTEIKGNRAEVKGELKTDTMMLKDLPQAVQTSINRERGTEADVESVKIKHETKDGRTVYKVQFEEKGKNTKLWVAEDGSIIKDSRK